MKRFHLIRLTQSFGTFPSRGRLFSQLLNKLFYNLSLNSK